MRSAYEVNCIAPLFISRAFLPLLERAATSAKADANLNIKSVHKAAIIQVSYVFYSKLIQHCSSTLSQMFCLHKYSYIYLFLFKSVGDCLPIFTYSF